jgi:hypothetical protein
MYIVGPAAERFAKEQDVPPIQFRKGQRKDDVMAQNVAQFRKSEGVVFGKAQEKVPVFRTEKRRHPETGQRYPWIVRSTAMVNQYHWYCVDAEFGPFFLKFSSYFPCNAKLCLNGHEYAKCQLRKEGIAFQALEKWASPNRRSVPQTAGARTASVYLGGPSSRIPLRSVDVASRILFHSSPGPPPERAHLLRTFRTRVLTAGDSLPARGLQGQPHQAIFQTGAGGTGSSRPYGNDHRQHARFSHRQAAV